MKDHKCKHDNETKVCIKCGSVKIDANPYIIKQNNINNQNKKLDKIIQLLERLCANNKG